MAHYLKTGNTIRIISEDDINITNILPPANYIVQFDKLTNEFFLEGIAPFELPTKLYGNVEKNTNRIVTSYHNRIMSTGVLLTGEKGSGKTMLAKNVSCNLLTSGVATIVINECYYGDVFNKFIQSINQPCVIMFDEFEKVYNNEKQEQILTLLDGVFPTKKLFIFTTNDTFRINNHLCNRPGRVFYTIQHHGLEEFFIREYCEDVLNNKQYIDDICKLSMLFSAFNFDILKSLIEEMNRYNESPAESLEILNAIPDDRNENIFNVELILNGIVFAGNNLDDDGTWTGNPMRPKGFTIEYHNPNYKDEDDNEDMYGNNNSNYWLSVKMNYTNLVVADSSKGMFEFKNEQDQVVKLTKQKTQQYRYAAF